MKVYLKHSNVNPSIFSDSGDGPPEEWRHQNRDTAWIDIQSSAVTGALRQTSFPSITTTTIVKPVTLTKVSTVYQTSTIFATTIYQTDMPGIQEDSAYPTRTWREMYSSCSEVVAGIGKVIDQPTTQTSMVLSSSAITDERTPSVVYIQSTPPIVFVPPTVTVTKTVTSTFRQLITSPTISLMPEPSTRPIETLYLSKEFPLIDSQSTSVRISIETPISSTPIMVSPTLVFSTITSIPPVENITFTELPLETSETILPLEETASPEIPLITTLNYNLSASTSFTTALPVISSSRASLINITEYESDQVVTESSVLTDTFSMSANVSETINFSTEMPLISTSTKCITDLTPSKPATAILPTNQTTSVTGDEITTYGDIIFASTISPSRSAESTEITPNNLTITFITALEPTISPKPTTLTEPTTEIVPTTAPESTLENVPITLTELTTFPALTNITDLTIPLETTRIEPTTITVPTSTTESIPIQVPTTTTEPTVIPLTTITTDPIVVPEPTVLPVSTTKTEPTVVPVPATTTEPTTILSSTTTTEQITTKDFTTMTELESITKPTTLESSTGTVHTIEGSEDITTGPPSPIVAQEYWVKTVLEGGPYNDTSFKKNIETNLTYVYRNAKEGELPILSDSTTMFKELGEPISLKPLNRTKIDMKINAKSEKYSTTTNPSRKKRFAVLSSTEGNQYLFDNNVINHNNIISKNFPKISESKYYGINNEMNLKKNIDTIHKNLKKITLKHKRRKRKQNDFSSYSTSRRKRIFNRPSASRRKRSLLRLKRDQQTFNVEATSPANISSRRNSQINVRVLNISYAPDRNETDIIYTVYDGSEPILAKDAVKSLDNIIHEDMTQKLGHKVKLTEGWL